MRRKKEFNGKDLNEALAKAATVLEVHQDEVHYRFLDEGRRGIMGLGARDVRIEVELPEKPRPARPSKPKTQPKPQQERNRRPRRAAKPQPESARPKRPVATSRLPPRAKPGVGREQVGAGPVARAGTGVLAGPAGNQAVPGAGRPGTDPAAPRRRWMRILPRWNSWEQLSGPSSGSST